MLVSATALVAAKMESAIPAIIRQSVHFDFGFTVRLPLARSDPRVDILTTIRPQTAAVYRRNWEIKNKKAPDQILRL